MVKTYESGALSRDASELIEKIKQLMADIKLFIESRFEDICKEAYKWILSRAWSRKGNSVMDGIYIFRQTNELNSDISVKLIKSKEETEETTMQDIF